MVNEIRFLTGKLKPTFRAQGEQIEVSGKVLKRGQFLDAENLEGALATATTWLENGRHKTVYIQKIERVLHLTTEED